MTTVNVRSTTEKTARLTGAALLLLLASCGGSGKRALTAAEASETNLSSAEPKAVSPSVNVSEDLAKKCNLRFGDVEQAPKFGFDTTDLAPQDREVLGDIAKCLTTGPLAGRKVKLVGHADPRGTTDYNMALGARRANGVAGYLKSLGVAQDKLAETSRGELDASGSDETTWQRDRRVDISLAD